ncbi:MAG: LCP family protein [Clostridia bacterium]|nr:LCP family protein [Clostridia bacterium]
MKATSHGDAAGNVQRRQDGTRFWRYVLFGLLLALLFTASMAGTLYGVLEGFRPGGGVRAREAVPVAAPDERLNVLVLGLDSEELGAQRSDTMMVVSLDPLTHEVGLLSIPRDTLVTIPGRHDEEKITHAHAYGGPELAMRTVQEFLGVPIHHYVRVDFQGFKAIIDAVGGVTVDVEKRMYYVDPYQDLRIDLQPGRQRLDGEKALEYARYRSDSDLFRIRRQQKLLQAVAAELLRPAAIVRLPALVRELQKYVVTDFSPGEMLDLVRRAPDYSLERAVVATVPTQPVHSRSGAYLGERANRREVEELVRRVLLGIDVEANRRVAVTVQDGGGGAQAVARVASALEDAGYAVTLAEGAARQEGTTVSFPAGGDEVAAKVLARFLRRELGPVAIFQRNQAEATETEGASLVVVVGQVAAGAPTTGGTGG